ncbi:MAG: adenosylcobinamide-GDP ribazoletransferase [Syntrophaceae bacterium]
MKPFFAALQFLTAIPIPAALGGTEKDLEKSIYFFPAAGLVLGALLAALDAGLAAFLPVLPASAIVVAALIMLTGGFHLDGLADTADGFMSSRPRERVLEIMKDSRTGPMGVMAVVSVLVLKVALLASVTGAVRPALIILMPVAGRSAMLMLMGALPYARPEGGLGSLFLRSRSSLWFIWGLFFLIAAGLAAAGWLGLAAAVGAALATALAAIYINRKIGGITGDTIGATCEVVELVPLLVAAAGIHRGLVA